MKILKFAVVALGLVFAAPAALTSLASPADAAPFFKCSSGYTFHLNSSRTGAHCRKKIPDNVKPINCPNVNLMGRRIGTFQQAKSGKDKCRGTVRIGGVSNSTEIDPANCNTGYAYKRNHQGRLDKCVKSGGWIYKAVTVQFNSN